MNPEQREKNIPEEPKKIPEDKGFITQFGKKTRKMAKILLMSTALGMGGGPIATSPETAKAAEPQKIEAISETTPAVQETAPRELSQEEKEIIKHIAKDYKKDSQEWLKVFYQLQENGVKIDARVMEYLTPEKAFNQDYINKLIELHQKYGLAIDGWCIGVLSPEKISDSAYISALIRLYQDGVCRDIVDLAQYLTPEKAKNPAHLNALAQLHQAGIVIDSQWLEYAQTDESWIKIAIEFHQAGIAINPMYLTPDKAKNENWVKAVYRLHQAGIETGGFFLDNLSLEKAQNEKWMQAISRLHQAGVFDGIAQYLTLERAEDKNWTSAVIKCQQAGIEVDYRIAGHLTLKQANDQRYIDLLVANQGEMEKADLAYLRQFYPDIPLSEINYPPNLFKILQDPQANELSKEIANDYFKTGLLKAVRQMNDLHESTADKRLAVIKDYNLDLLYRAVVLGNEEVYTSSFNLIFDGMDYRGREKEYSIMEQMKKEGIDGYDLLKRADPEKKITKSF